MQIDWFTVIAQIINFLILVALLKHFLYVPIITSMDQRAKMLEQKASEAQSNIRQADEQRMKYENSLATIETQKKEIMSEFVVQIDAQRKKRLNQIRSETDELKRAWLNTIQHEQQELLNEVHNILSAEAVNLSRRMMRELADDDLDLLVCRKFINNLKKHDKDDIQLFCDACRTDNDNIILYSAFELSQKAQHELKIQLRSVFYPELNIDFRIKSDLICGIFIVAHDRNISWNIEDAFGSLDYTLHSKLRTDKLNA